MWNFVAKSWVMLSKWWPLMTWQGVSRLERSEDWLVADDPDVWWWRRWRAWPGHWSPGTHGITLQTIYNQSDWEKRKVWPRHLQFNSMHYNYHERLREFWKKIPVVTLRNINKKRMNQMVLTIIRLCTYYYYDSGLDVGVEKSNKSWW